MKSATHSLSDEMRRILGSYFFFDFDGAWLGDSDLGESDLDEAPPSVSMIECEDLPSLEQEAGTGFTPTRMEAYVTPGTAFWARSSSGMLGFASFGTR